MHQYPRHSYVVVWCSPPCTEYSPALTVRERRIVSLFAPPQHPGVDPVFRAHRPPSSPLTSPTVDGLFGFEQVDRRFIVSGEC